MGPRRVGLAFLLLLLIAPAARPQANDTKRPADPADARLWAAANRLAPGVVLVGNPDDGQGWRGHGSAFVLSRAHRLLATNAHVASTMQGGAIRLAVPNGSTYGGPATYRVERVYYHPGVVREMGEGLLVRSADRTLGPVRQPCPDVAVLQLAPGGPELPEPLPMAGPEALKKLGGQPVGLLGFRIETGWPELGESVRAQYRRGTALGLIDFELDDTDDPAGDKLVCHTADGQSGFSGGPLFTADGRVVALHSGNVRFSESDKLLFQLAIRIDCLWELIVHHKLDRLVPLDDARRQLAELPEQPGPDPRIARYRRALALADRARAELRAGDYRAADATCREAARLAPEFARAHALKAEVRMLYCGRFWGKLTDEVRREQVEGGLAEIRRALRFLPRRVRGRTTAEYLDAQLVCQQLLLQAGALGDAEAYRDARTLADRLVKDRAADAGRTSRLLGGRAHARQAMGDADGALADFNAALALNPADAALYTGRARCLDRLGRHAHAEDDRRVADSLRRGRALTVQPAGAGR